jgi:hypothetical protein
MDKVGHNNNDVDHAPSGTIPPAFSIQLLIGTVALSRCHGVTTPLTVITAHNQGRSHPLQLIPGSGCNSAWAEDY